MPREGFPRALLQAAQSERLGYFRAYTIAHPRLKAVSAALWRAIQEPAGRALILVIGPTGVGKTTLRLRMEQELQQRFLAAGASEPGRIPVVGLEAVAPDSGNFSWKEYYRRALRALEEPLIDDKIDYATPHRFRNHAGEFTVPPRVGNPELRQAMEQALRHRRPAAVLIDEAQHVTKMASGRRLADQLDCHVLRFINQHGRWPSMPERLFHRLTQLGVADSGRDGELASVVAEPVGGRIIDFVID